MEKTGSKIDIIKIYIADNWKSFLVVSVLSALASLMEVFGIFAFVPLLAKEADIPLPDFITAYLQDLTTVQILMIISSLFFAKALILVAVAYIKARIFTGYEKNFIYKFFDSTVGSRWQYFITKPVGEIINTALKECPAAAMIYTHITMMFSGALQLAVLMFFSLYISWEATLLGGIGGILLLKSFDFMPKKLKALGGEFQGNFKKTSGTLTDFFTNIKPLKSMNKDQALFDAIRPKLAEQAELRKNLQFLKGSISIIMEPFIVIFVCLLLYFSLEMIKMSFAETFVMIVIFYKLMTGWRVFNQSIMSVAEYEHFFWALDKEIKETERQKEVTTGTKEQVFQDQISLQHIDFEYVEGQKILSDLSFDIEKNKLTAIVGSSGSGKTTIIDLICKLHEQNSGQVLIDGVDLREIKTSFWRDQIGYVPQEFFMLHDTLRHNITLGDERYSDEQIKVALKKAGALDFVMAQSEGLDMVVGEKGVRFSGGQRQRISLARALLREPKILILDEATTALDPDTEKAICQELKNLSKDTTVIAISHQLTILDVADHVIELGKTKHTKRASA